MTDLKPRSRDVTDGLERAAARGDAARRRHERRGLRQAADRRRVVAGTRSRRATCRCSGSASAAKEGVHRAGGFPMEFGTISVSDGISMGHDGMHYSLVSREVIADSVETVVQAERLDGIVLLAGCDKSLPGMLMAAARLDLAAVFVYGGLDPARARRRPGGQHRRRVRGRRRACARARSPATRSTRSSARSARARAPAAACTPPTRWPRGRGARAWRCPARPRRPRSTGAATASPARSGEAVVGMLDEGHHRPADPDPRGVRERDRRGDGARRVDQRGAAPARDRARGRASPLDARRLQPDRRPGPAPGRRQAVRPLRDDRPRPGRRRAGGDEGAAGRRAAARRRADRDRQDGGREPRRRSTRPTWTATSCARWPTRSTRPAASRSCAARSRPRARWSKSAGLRRGDRSTGTARVFDGEAGRDGRDRRRHAAAPATSS